jgi:hypothetical protein
VVCSTNGGEEDRVYVIGEKARGKKPLSRPRCRWVDNIGMDLGEVGWSDVGWMVWLRIGTGGKLLRIR